MAEITTQLIWSNPSPTSNFAAQTLTVEDISSYKYLLVACAASSGNPSSSYTLMPVVSGTSARVTILFSSAANNKGNRDFVITNSTQIQIKSAAMGGSTSAKNQYLIPLKIYGVDGLL